MAKALAEMIQYVDIGKNHLVYTSAMMIMNPIMAISFPCYGLDDRISLAVVMSLNSLVLYFEGEIIYKRLKAYNEMVGPLYKFQLALMIGLNFLRDLDILLDVKFLVILDKKEDDALMVPSLLIFIWSLVPRVIAAFGLSCAVAEYIEFTK